MRLADLSWRLKVPLLITAVILLTEVVVTALLVTRALGDARRDLEASAESLTKLLARSLRDPVLRDDLWQAFEVVSAPLAARAKDSPLQSIVLLDLQERVLVSTDPKRHPVLLALEALPPASVAVARAAAAEPGFQFSIGKGESGLELAAAGPILAEDGTHLGTVVLDFDAVRYAERVRATVAALAWLSIPGLLLLVPLGWYAGERLTKPLATMAEALGRVGIDPPARVRATLPPESADEIGRLSSRAREMLDGLERKAALEQEVLATERLAAVGRVAATIAHEINNPLGGMINAVDTAERHGEADAITGRTLGLLARGLDQIRATVGALLVEARLDSPYLRAEDWDDLRTLVGPHAEARQVALQWAVEAEARTALPLPAHDVRQLVLNLLLNATTAAKSSAGGPPEVRLAVQRGPLGIRITVSNTGPDIPLERLSRIFEPFISPEPLPTGGGHGLGLWVCWQLVQRLGGTIDATSSEGWTRVAVSLPLADPAGGEDATR